MADEYINTLNLVISNITLYVPYVTIILGTVGAFCNLLTFSAKQFRRNACAFYFLCSAGFDLLTLLICGVMRLMVDHYSYVLPNKSEIFCKIRVYLTAVFPLISTACIVLASIDRCLLTSTSMKWRRWTTIKMAYILVIISIIIGIISPSHMLVFYGFYVVSGSSPSCSSQPGVYGAFVSIFLVVWFTFIPYIIMFISSCTTFVHIRASRNRVMPVQQQNHRRTDRSLITLVFIQVILSMILLAMRTVLIAHLYMTRDIVKDRTTRSVESFMSQLGTVFYYINYAKSFYLCTLTSKLFRDAFLKQCEIFWKCIAHQQRETTVVPLSATALTKKRSIQPILSRQ